MKLEEKLVALRKAKGLSQLQLAEMMDISRQAISRWEVGTAIPSTDSLKYLGRLFDVPLEYLLHDDAPEPEQQLKADISAREGGKGEIRYTALLIVCAVFIVLIFCGLFWKEKNQKTDEMNMGNMEGSEVITEGEFELEF